MDRLLQDIRFGFRSLVKSPIITLAALASLGLGIGANASIFSAIDTFLIKPLDFEDADRLLAVWSSDLERGWDETSTSVPDYRDWRERSRTTDVAAYTGAGMNLTGTDEPERLEAFVVTSNFFDVLRKRPVLGRSFLPEEEGVEGARVVILSDGLWRTRFGADRDIIGRVIGLDGQPHEVVGVMPPKVGIGGDVDVWIPFRWTGSESRNSRFLAVLGRLRPGSDIDAARAELGTIQGQLAATYTESKGTGVTLRRLQEEWFDEGFRQGSLIAGTAVLFVLLIACANVANLLLARAAGREREVALRTAVGAGRGVILRQLMTESILLGLGGGVLGLLLSVAGIRWVRGLFPPFLQGVEGVTLNLRVVAFVAALSILCGVLFGLAPAVRGTRLNLRGLLTDQNRGTTGTRGNRIRSALVIAEIGLSVVLLIASVLLVQAFVGLRRTDLGFRTDRVTVAVTVPAQKYETNESVEAFHTQLLDAIAAVPGVESVGATHLLPMRGNSARLYTIPDEPPPEPGREPTVSIRYVTAGYFETMDIARTAGRTLQPTDRIGAMPVVVINERMADFHWSGQNAVGRRIRFGDVDHEVVGIVADTRDYGPDDEPGRLVYLPALQNGVRTLRYVIAADLETTALVTAIRDVVRRIDPEQPVYGINTIEAILEDELGGSAAMAKVLGMLGLIAFLLSAVGVYGVMAYSVAQRTQELGIRMALGAQRADVLGLVFRRGALITGAGIVIGLLIASGVTRLLAFFLFGVSPFHPLAFASVPIMLALTGAFASWLPALRATRVDPLSALRTD